MNYSTEKFAVNIVIACIVSVKKNSKPAGVQKRNLLYIDELLLQF